MKKKVAELERTKEEAVIAFRNERKESTSLSGIREELAQSQSKRAELEKELEENKKLVEEAFSEAAAARVEREDALSRLEEYSGVDMEKIFGVLAASKKRIKDLREEKSVLEARVEQLERELQASREQRGGNSTASKGGERECEEEDQQQQKVEQEREDLQSSRKNLALQRLDTFISSVKARNMVLRGAFDRIASKIGMREERIVGRMLQDKLHDRTVAAEQVTKRLVAVEDSCKKLEIERDILFEGEFLLL